MIQSSALRAKPGSRVSRRLVWLPASVLLFSPLSTMANSPNIGRDAGSIFPLRNDAVRLVSEEVAVWLPVDSADSAPDLMRKGKASCVYLLRNLTDKEQKLDMAFLTTSPFSPTPEGFRYHYREANFRVRARGQDLQVRYEGLDKGRWQTLTPLPPDSLPTWSVTIGGLDTLGLRMSYDVEWSSAGDEKSVQYWFEYYARPAALWAGNIDQATISFEVARPLAKHLPGDTTSVAVSVKPEDYNWINGRLVWTRRNWEPTEDFRLEIEWSLRP
jgi:hypothetical protein